MKMDQLAAQLYTLRDHLKTAEQVASTLRKVRKIGFHAVEVAGVGPIGTAELARALDGEGLVCCATHEDSAAILNTPEEVVERLNTLGCTYVANPYPANADLTTPRAVKAFARNLSKAGQVLHESGRVLAYHNHDIEFIRLKGVTILDIIVDESDSEYLKFELDAHWVQAGGANPSTWCRKLNKRLPLLHMKDYAVTEERKRVFAEVGSGNLDWPDILHAADDSGCAWYIVEQDDDWVDNDPFKSLKRSFQFIKDRLAE